MDHKQRALLHGEGRWGPAESSMTRHSDWSSGVGRGSTPLSMLPLESLTTSFPLWDKKGNGVKNEGGDLSPL